MHPGTRSSRSAQGQRDSVDEGDSRPSPGMLEVTASDASDVQAELSNAVAVVARAADEHRTGILITRTGADRYIVRAHPAVPYGFIRRSYV
jgi:hypothetical protein